YGLEGKTKFVGYVSNPKLFLETLNIFVAPSHEEAFGINVCEAMERGLAVVASGVGGIREIIRDQIDGILCKPGDSLDLSQALASLLESQETRRILGKNARDRIVENFQRKTCVKSHQIL
ncbi:glycosyltransferase family 4 protein, partial [bacterium]|nr:glycosyltransferase family 4 protein [bacterium]